VILAAPGSGGKSVASGRLPPPWQTLSDDTSLVVRSDSGEFWAHPWPNWTRYASRDPDGSWEVERGVLLRAVFFLRKADQDRVLPVGPAEAACMLLESAEQAWRGPLRASGWEGEKARRLRVQRLENSCVQVKRVPCHVLELTLDGAFWTEVEALLGGEDSECR
jgi:SynChlorMet cassette protein ScmC